MWQRFTENARKTIFYAQEEAQKVGEGYVSTEHMLLGLLRAAECSGASILVSLGMSLATIQNDVEKQLPRGDSRPSQDMSLTPRAKRVIDLAYDEARNFGHNHIGSEHLLLGMVREGDGLAGRVLEKHGVHLEAVRNEVSKLTGSTPRPLSRGLFGIRKGARQVDQSWVKPIVMEGCEVRLEPLETKHAKQLAEACDSEMFQFFPTYPASFDKAGLVDYINERNATPKTVAYAIVHRESRKAIGSSSFFDIREGDRGLEVGHTWIKKEHRGTKVNPEVKLLMLGHAFEALGALRVQLKTDSRNVHSQRAMLKMGAKQEGVLRKNMVMPDGYVRDSVFFSVIAEEWPAVREGLLARLRA